MNSLKFTIQKAQLNEAIQHVSRAISNRTTVPILLGIKMDVHHDGVTLTASDTDIWIQSFVPTQTNEETVVQVEKTGSIVVPAKFFIEIIRKLPTKDIHMISDNRQQILITSGSTEIQLTGLDSDEYPSLPRISEKNSFSISSHLLDHMIHQVSFAVSANESTPVLTGVLWNLKDEILKFVATDRHRLASIEKKIPGSEGKEFQHIVISGKNLNELSKILPEQDGMIDVVVSENQVLFRLGQVLFYTRILDGTYPDTSKIIPQSYRTELSFHVKPLSDAIERAYLLSREEKTNIVRLTSEDHPTQVEISSSSNELGKVIEQLEIIRSVGEQLRISFNSKYMLDVLRVIKQDTIHIGFTGAMSPMILKCEAEEGILHLILPYRTTN